MTPPPTNSVTQTSTPSPSLHVATKTAVIVVGSVTGGAALVVLVLIVCCSCWLIAVRRKRQEKAAAALQAEEEYWLRNGPAGQFDYYDESQDPDSF